MTPQTAEQMIAAPKASLLRTRHCWPFECVDCGIVHHDSFDCQKDALEKRLASLDAAIAKLEGKR